MKTFVSDSDNLTIVAPIQLYSGVPAQIGGITCVPNTNANVGELVSVMTCGVYEFNLTGSANIGDPVYFKPSADGTTYTITNQPTTGFAMGYATEAGKDQPIDIMIDNSLINDSTYAKKTDLASYIQTAQLNAYIQTAQLNAAIVKAVTDPTVKAAIKTAATT